ncbi:DHS-like NAD/FAD-binding domain containing protein [Amanita muscaria]
MSSDYAAFRAALQQAKHILVLAGAGLSAASGIPTFRGAGGLWRNFDVTRLATPEAFKESPSRVWQFYHYRREVARAAKPNPAHRAIALLSSSAEELKRVAPSALTFQLITQNIDNLSNRALPNDAPRLALPIEMHGNLFRVKCTKCGFAEMNFESPICEALTGTEASFKNGEPEREIELKYLPKCRQCGSLTRPGVVWFGEEVEHLDDIDNKVEKQCDFIMVVGTSSQVMPAGIFADIVRNNRGKVAVFNIELTRADKLKDFIFLGPCEETLVKALDVEGRLD